MPQLDTSTWPITITLTTLAVFCIYQLKMLNQNMISTFSQDQNKLNPKTQLPWKNKWTKIYLPHSSPQQS
uniref:ATP synthase complex subunit 8 n=1 Tax=Pseudochirops albertisii TaxID=699040 RepID=A0A075QVI0_9META|nr:ATP synthase F0 subunit 8 [Pseudochirops albertisii]